MLSRYVEFFFDKNIIEKIKKLKSSYVLLIDINLIVLKNYLKILKRESVKDLLLKLKMIIKSIFEKRFL